MRGTSYMVSTLYSKTIFGTGLCLTLNPTGCNCYFSCRVCSVAGTDYCVADDFRVDRGCLDFLTGWACSTRLENA